MLVDGYGNPLSTRSTAARDAYVEGYCLLFMTWPGAAAAFARATEADPHFALAHIGAAQVAAMQGDLPRMQGALAAAKAAAPSGPGEREASHLAFFEKVFAGQTGAAVEAARDHLATWPRDAVVFNVYAPILGLISQQGASGSKRRQAEVMDAFVAHYGDDWWFIAHRAMALAEVGRMDEARALADQALESEPRNAWAMHSRAHIAYESNEPDGARPILASFLESTPREVFLRVHLAWHSAIAELHAGHHEAARARFETDVAAELSTGPARKVHDAVSFLWRWELAGHPRDPERWRTLDALAHSLLPRAGLSFTDIHVALADAVAGDRAALDGRLAQMDALEQAGRYPAGGFPQTAARGLAAYAEGDPARAIALLAPLLPELERVGQASRAQHDLIEFTALRACVDLGRHDELRDLLARRRKGPGAVPVAGVH